MKIQKNALSATDRTQLLDAAALLIAKAHGIHVSDSATAWAVSVVDRAIGKMQMSRQQQLFSEDNNETEI